MHLVELPTLPGLCIWGVFDRAPRRSASYGSPVIRGRPCPATAPPAGRGTRLLFLYSGYRAWHRQQRPAVPQIPARGRGIRSRASFCPPNRRPRRTSIVAQGYSLAALLCRSRQRRPLLCILPQIQRTCTSPAPASGPRQGHVILILGRDPIPVGVHSH